jgi:hypothetical protein
LLLRGDVSQIHLEITGLSRRAGSKKSPCWRWLTGAVTVRCLRVNYLQSDKKLWSGVTETVLREDTDRLAEVGPLVTKVVAALLAALRADDLIR